MTITTSPVTAIPAVSPERAFAFFAERLGCQADPADVWYAMRDSREKGAVQDFTVVDVRAEGAYRKAHLPGAISLPIAEITGERVAGLPSGLLVVYCWGPACNGSTKGAMKLAALGREVKEMIGGLEYWVREGWPTEGRRPIDPKTATPADLGLVC
ncbi:rhodanese-like domain-containing protein [Kitasatospora sp. GP82]|uniref:rhodanese-like domain-containing protein n=1 Tax=Kitasatospora sp. GP82 TaxID=3035089 RepID=UPI002475C948|nr:rhodanese-like domain-containing protein [Kitasatospora sp. GP82]MDH6123584.1 rhodanese-related sulfurtransferase [Kitasatospora sp. GP82]